MKENVSISNAEMKVMNKIWEAKRTVTVKDMMTILNAEGEKWAYQTVATFFRRLEAKCIIASEKKKKTLYYYPLMSREEYVKEEARGFVSSRFGGSLKGFLAAFSDDIINENDIKELRVA